MVSNELLAGALGVLLGALFVFAPAQVARLYTGDPEAKGEYGADVSDVRWAGMIRLVGVAMLAAGGYFLYTAGAP